MNESEQNGNDEQPSAAEPNSLPNVVYTQDELERLLGKAQARQIFELREAASRIHPTREEIRFAFKVCARSGPLPTAAEMRVAAPAFVAWLRAANMTSRKARGGGNVRSFDAFRAWIRLHYPEDYAVVLNASSQPHRRRISVREARELLERGLKWCPECQTAKPIEDFNQHNGLKRSGGVTGRQTYCRVCGRQREAARRAPALELPPVPGGSTTPNSLNETEPMTIMEGVTHGIQTRE